MEDSSGQDEKLSYIIILLFTLLFIVLYFIYLTLVALYIFENYCKKKLSLYWIQYLITSLTSVLFIFVYLCYLMSSKGSRINPLNEKDNPSFIIILTIFLVSDIYIIINNLIFDSIASIILSINIYKMTNINTLDFQELYLKIKKIKIDIFDKKKHILYWCIFGVIDICLIIFFECEYNVKDKNEILHNFILFFIKYAHLICFIVLIICNFILNFLKQKFFIKNYYNTDKLAMKIYNINSCQIVYNTDIFTFKIILDLLINTPILVFLIFKVSNSFFLIVTEIILYFYIKILGALYFKIDKNNDIGKISKNIKYWFSLKKFNFHFGENDHKIFINENTYKYSKEEKEILKQLKLDKIDGIYDNEKNIEINSITKDDSTMEIRDESVNSIDKRKSKIKNKILNFDTNSELYVLYKLLMLYFDKNENIYLDVQNKINQDGTPFKQFFTEQNITKNKKIKARQTFGGSNALSKKNNFISNIDRISRISKMNSSSVIPFMKFKENKIFFSLEEKELKEEFKKKFNLSEKETTFKIEALSAMAFFELFPFYQISIQDIIKSLNPSDNKKIYNILRKNNEKNLKKSISIDSNNELDSENNLFYTYNSLLMMEIYEPEEFISFDELQKFTLSYGTYLLDIIKNINFTFIPLILGVFNIEICGENKVIILYRNPLFFSNYNHFNHWINFYITEGPEKLKVSILQNDIIDLNEIEIKNSLKMNEADYEEIINNLKRDFNFFMKMNIQVYPIIHLFIGDENNASGKNNNDANESSLIDTSLQQNNLSGILTNLDEGGGFNNINNNNNNKNIIDDDNLYMTESNSLVDKEYYSITGYDIHTLKIYFTHFFRLDCELNRQNDKNDHMILKSNHYCQYLEGQLQTYLTKTTLFELDDNENN